MSAVHVATAGEHVLVRSELAWASAIVEEASVPDLADAAPSLEVRIERGTRAFDLAGATPIARGVVAAEGRVIVADVATSGFDLLADATGDHPVFSFRWRPSARTRALRVAFRSRQHLLTRAALLQFPALWRAALRGRAPLHVAACTVGEDVPLLAGPGGVGKTTLVAKEVASGGRASGDNLAVSDGRSVWGLVEPLRVEGGRGRKMPHGRTEAALDARAEVLVPDRVLVLQRGRAEEPDVCACSQEQAARALVAGTYAAKELHRFWSFAAVLAIGTGLGPAHPPVAEVAGELAGRLPALIVTLPRRPGPELGRLLAMGVETCA